ncbi:MAG: Fic family protein [Candidatus Methanoplasma sp.]|jgi:Fic family protein|nr:Fic family protein [Candidatus Methanoplasma sp.]
MAHTYDYSFLKDLRVPAGLLTVTNRISEMRVYEESRKVAHSDVFSALADIAVIQSVKGSNAIEGILTTDERIEKIVKGNSTPLNRSEMEIAGYRDALRAVHENHDVMDISERTIKGLHRAIGQYTGEGGGEYKVSDNAVLAIDAHGNRTVRFTPVAAAETPDAMVQLILAFMDAHSDSRIDSMLLIPCFILDFLCIHPFLDGNGRVSRLISLLLMYREGMDAGKYVSFEEQINRTKREYYRSLSTSSRGWHENQNDYVPFIENFAHTLLSCYMDMNSRFAVVADKKTNKKNRIEAAAVNSLVPISKKDIAALLPDVSITTIEARLAELVKEERIVKIGDKRGARYIATGKPQTAHRNK